MLNASVLDKASGPSFDFLDILEVNPDFESGPWVSPSTCHVYSMVLGAGRYLLEAWGASGGFHLSSTQSAGGYSSGILMIDKATRIFAVAGGIGQTASGETTAVAGGCNGGGSGKTEGSSGWFYSGGGGASHIAALENSLSHRILVAGGAGGSHTGNGQAKGGEGGGEKGNNGYIYRNDYVSNGQGANQTSPGIECAKTDANYPCSPGSFGAGGSNPKVFCS